jgi:hypothetical protein
LMADAAREMIGGRERRGRAGGETLAGREGSGRRFGREGEDASEARRGTVAKGSTFVKGKVGCSESVYRSLCGWVAAIVC